MLGFINKNKILTFFAAMAATQISLYNILDERHCETFSILYYFCSKVLEV